MRARQIIMMMGTLMGVWGSFSVEAKSKLTEKDKRDVVTLLKKIKPNSGIFTKKELLTRRINTKETIWWKRALVSADLYIDKHGDEVLNRSFDRIAHTTKLFIETQQKLFDLFHNDGTFEQGMELVQKLRNAITTMSRDTLATTRYVIPKRSEIKGMILNLHGVLTDAAHELEQQYIASSLNRKKKEEKICNSLFPLECK